MKEGVRFTRRQFLSGLATLPLLRKYHHLNAASLSPSHSIALKPQAIEIDGKPIFLAGGSMDYFRCPPQLWRDRLLQLSRAGVNTVTTYVAWNFHERQKGVFRFDEECDLGRFIDLAAQLGLYAFIRVGPFICDEWEAGGYPAWLMAEPGVQFRTVDPIVQPYIRRWFEQLVRVLAPRQVTRGGPVILVQQENEYYYPDRPNAQQYQQFLIDTLRQGGIEVPLTDCNGSSPSVRVPGSIQTVNGGGANAVISLRKEYPDLPVIVSELYTDYTNCWGWPISSYPTTRMVEQQAFATLAAGGMFSYFMFYGGTNFDSWASNTWKSDQSFITTRYYSRAPIAEGGVLNPTYTAVSWINHLAANFVAFYAHAQQAALPVTISGPSTASAAHAEQGFMIAVQPRYPVRDSADYHTAGDGSLIELSEKWPMAELADAAAVLNLPNGISLPLTVSSSTPSMLPYAFNVAPGCHIDYCNATLLGTFGVQGRRILLLCGDEGKAGVLSVQGRRIDFVFPAQPVLLAATEGVQVLAVPTHSMSRCWFLDDRLIVGPAFVGEKKGDRYACFGDAAPTTALIVSSDGSTVQRTIPASPSRAWQSRLGEWSLCAALDTVQDAGSWRPLSEPKSVEELGAYWGYSWYRASAEIGDEPATTLFFTSAADRIHVYTNARWQGVWGRGPGATRDPLPLQLERGRNQITFLCDNMGRLSEGGALDRKGIFGPVYFGAKAMSLPAPRVTPGRAPSDRSWRFKVYHQSYPNRSFSVWHWEIPVVETEGLTLSLRWFPDFAWLYVDGQLAGEHAGDFSLVGGVDFRDFVLDPWLKADSCHLELLVYGNERIDLLTHFNLIRYDKRKLLQNWEFQPATPPDRFDRRTKLPNGPAWWKTEFRKPAYADALFLAPQQMSKGHAYINGHDLGRYWEIGPQHTLYVPEPWLKETNELLLFDEAGYAPEEVYLFRDARALTDPVLI